MVNCTPAIFLGAVHNALQPSQKLTFFSKLAFIVALLLWLGLTVFVVFLVSSFERFDNLIGC